MLAPYGMVCLICRSVRTEDITAVVALDRLCFGGLWSQDAYQRELESPNSDLLVLEITDEADSQSGNKIIGIGCVWSILEEAHITLLGIDPGYRRYGFGQWLLIHLLLLASDRGLTHATLEVRPSNNIAIKLYEKFGFIVAGERRRYYSDGENALILWKRGLQDSQFLPQIEIAKTHWQNTFLHQGWQVSDSFFELHSCRSPSFSGNECFSAEN